MTTAPLRLRDDTLRTADPQRPAPEELFRDPVEAAWQEVKGRSVVPASPVGPRLPCDLQLGFLLDPRLRVCAPIRIHLSVESGGIVAACAEELNEYGYGDDSAEAIADLQRALSELYFSLRDDEDALGADLRRTWARLRDRIELRK